MIKTKNNINTAWKCLRLVDGKIKSDSGNHIWELNKWYHEDNISLCNHGFHASKLSIDAMRFVGPDIFAIIGYKGTIIEDNDKFVSSDMCIIKAFEWSKPDSLQFSIFCVKQSMKYFDRKKFPNVWTVCLNSIKAIDAVLLNDTEETRLAALSAARSARSAAWSAESAARSARSAALSAAESAARSARLAALSAAESAALSAGWSAESAGWSAESAARSARSAVESAARLAAESAARSAAKKLLDKWLKKYVIKNCKRIE